MAQFVRFNGPGNRPLAINPENVAAVVHINPEESDITLVGGAVVRVRSSLQNAVASLEDK